MPINLGRIPDIDWLSCEYMMTRIAVKALVVIEKELQ